jgi:hypothetical protein
MAPKGSEFEQAMTRLEAELKRLEAEYNMFFAGRLPRLPWETRARVDTMVKQYDRMHLNNTAQKFRFATLQARYVAFCDLWERNLKAKEEGRPQRRTRTAPPQAAPKPAPRAARPDREPLKEAGPKVVAVASISDPAKDTDRMKALYEQLSKARKQAGEQPLPFDSFAKVVRAQVSKLGGGKDVAFRVTVQSGKVTLAAKATKDEE